MSVEYQDIVKHSFTIEEGILTIMNIGYIPQIMEEFLLKCLKKYVLELICDYLAAAKTYGADPRREYTWWLKQQPHMKIHKTLRVI